MAREAITAERLYALLARAYAQERVVDCVTRCPMPRPIFRDANGEDIANWIVQPGPKCPRHCHRIVAETAERLAATYDLATSA